jgi:hypothetical protein
MLFVAVWRLSIDVRLEAMQFAYGFWLVNVSILPLVLLGKIASLQHAWHCSPIMDRDMELTEL